MENIENDELKKVDREQELIEVWPAGGVIGNEISDEEAEETMGTKGYQAATNIIYKLKEAVNVSSMGSQSDDGLDKFLYAGSAEHETLKNNFLMAGKITVSVSQFDLPTSKGSQKVFGSKILFYKEGKDQEKPFFELDLKFDQGGSLIGNVGSVQHGAF
ncbi:MAG: hypothetical protein NTV48_01285 [Candidatus Vogelbacteria bacterium]|nr:hypothetical protein [Candidatus Vogelbacteria bacterium]